MNNGEDLELKAWMRDLAAGADPGGPLPDPHLIWWKAQLRERLTAEAKATRPIRVMEGIACGIGATAAVLAAVYWPHIPLAQAATLLAAAAGLGAAVVLLRGVLREE